MAREQDKGSVNVAAVVRRMAETMRDRAEKARRPSENARGSQEEAGGRFAVAADEVASWWRTSAGARHTSHREASSGYVRDLTRLSGELGSSTACAARGGKVPAWHWQPLMPRAPIRSGAELTANLEDVS